jgi:FMN reductase
VSGDLRVVAVSAGETAPSKTLALAQAALEAAGGGTLVELRTLSAEGLLGRVPDADVEAAVTAAADADVLVLASPIYRATVTGALKSFLDRFPTDALRGTAVVLAATAGSPQHFLALDTSGRALVASLGGWSVPTVAYATGADFVDGQPGDALRALVAQAVHEARSLHGAKTRAQPA